MPDKAACEEIFTQAADAARAFGVTGIEVIITGADSAITHFDNTPSHQNVAECTTQISVRPVMDGRTARASTNRVDREGIRAVVEQAVAFTRLTESDPELPPLADPAGYEPVERH